MLEEQLVVMLPLGAARTVFEANILACIGFAILTTRIWTLADCLIPASTITDPCILSKSLTVAIICYGTKSGSRGKEVQ